MKSREPSLPGGPNGRKIANPAAFGFSWTEMQKALALQQRVWADSRKISEDLVAAEEEIRGLRGREIVSMADAMLRGPGEEGEADDAALDEAQANHERLKKRSEAARLALNRANAEIYSLVGKRREAWVSEIRQSKEQSHYQLLAALERLRMCLSELASLDALEKWLLRPNRSFAPSPGPNEISTWAHGDLRMDQILEGLEKAGADLVEERHPVLTGPS